MLFDLHYKWSIEGMIDWLIDWSAQSKDMIVRITVFFLIWQIPNKRLFGNVEGSNLSSTDRDTTVEHTVYKIFLIIMYVAMLCMNLPILDVADDMSDSELSPRPYKTKTEVLHIMTRHMFSLYAYDLHQ